MQKRIEATTCWAERIAIFKARYARGEPVTRWDEYPIPARSRPIFIGNAFSRPSISKEKEIERRPPGRPTQAEITKALKKI